MSTIPPDDMFSTPSPSHSGKTNEDFTHAKLNPAKQEFRLLRILPAPENTTIECEIITESFGKLPYKAISYTWGAVEPLHEQSRITLNGRSFPIRQNLLSFLQTARQQDISKSWLWIDAICIDQTNIPERNSQVQFMDKIYEQAEEVIAWLGPAGDNSDWVVDVIRSTHESDRSVRCEAVRLLKEEKRLEALMRRPYWRRVWVVQELLLSKQVRFLCGQKEFSWANMRDLIIDVEIEMGITEWNENEGPRLTTAPDIHFLYSTSCIIIGKAFLLKPSCITSLWVAISIFANFECADPRDRVYGLQSLVPPKVRVVVDYSKSMEEVLDDVMLELREISDSAPEGLVSIERLLRRRWNLEDLMSPV